MASQPAQTFKPEDYSRFFIREFLKKNGFDKTYDAFMAEDTRPKVTMTKNVLTGLLGLDQLMRKNAKTKTFSTMLDVVSNYLSLTKQAEGGVDLPSPTKAARQSQSLSSKAMASNNKAQNQNPYSGANDFAQKSGAPKQAAQAQTSTNFFNPALSSNSSVEVINRGNKPGQRGRPGADKVIDDWDEDEPATVQNTTDLNFYKHGGRGAFEYKGGDVSSNDISKPLGRAPGADGGQNSTFVQLGNSKQSNNFLGGPSQQAQIPNFANQQRLKTANPATQKRRPQFSQVDQDLSDDDDAPWPNSKAAAGKKRKNDDIDDLDDLMGGMGLGGKKEDDDFFGGGAKKKSKGKKKEEADDNPLAFLQRAQQAKQEKQQKEQEQAEQASTAYKPISELQYSLTQLSKTSDNFNGSAPSSMQGMQSSGVITPADSQRIKRLLFKSDTANFHDSWCQGFFFDQKLKYGIFQDQGGPCGILATVQAFFLKHLLFVHQVKLQSVTKAHQANFVASAITDILINSASDTPTRIVSLVLPQDGRAVRPTTQPIQPNQCSVSTFPSSQRNNILNAVRLNLSCFSEAKSHGVILLVYSVILTRGTQQLQDDMDLAENALLNEFGYASQELINTMLVGRGSSNVHDGDKDMGDDLVLKGIHRQSEVGFLTFFEHFGYFQVGSYLKQPTVPIWIVCSESHYSVLFSVDKNVIGQQTGKEFDLIYYDELSRQEDDLILTVQLGKYQPKTTGKQYTVPIDSVIRTKWENANVDWNGRTVIL